MTHEQRTRLGIFLSIATVIFVAVAGFFIVPKLRDPGTVYRIEFRDISIQGLIVGSLVKYRGVQVGRVTRIEVSPTSFDTVDVEVKIKPELVVKTDMRVTLVYVGLTGQKYIEISGGTLGSPNLAAHGVIPTAKGLGERADDIVNNIETTAKRINELLSAENVARVTAFLENSEKASATLSGFSITADLAREHPGQLREGLRRFRPATEKFVHDG